MQQQHDYQAATPFIRQVGRGWLITTAEFLNAGPAGLTKPESFTADVEGDWVKLKHKQAAARVELALLKGLKKRHLFQAHLFATVQDSHAVVAVTSEDGDRFPLVCLDSASGKVLWQAEVWANGREKIGGHGGSPPNHRLDISIQDGQVIVFGRGSGDVYLESFALKTGKSLLRFNTNLWLETPKEAVDGGKP